jgi:ATP-dependent DNA ligase
MEKHPTLYKRTLHGKIQIWYMESDGAKYRTVSGQQDGVLTTTDWTICEAKNVGRANATTPEEQCQAQVKSGYEYRLARDYHTTPKTVDVEMRFKPMLASKWQDHKSEMPDRVFVQPKLDGIRCIVNKSGMWTREGKPILGAPHIFEIFEPLFEDKPDVIFDGELYNHDLKDDFNKIISCVRKTKPTAKDLEVSEELIQYHIYDLAFMGDASFMKRHFAMSIVPVHPKVVVVETRTCGVNEVDEIAAEYIALGYEGAMVRNPDAAYENRRSRSLLKWKEFQDQEFPIVDVLPGQGNAASYAARVVLRLPDGREFSSGMIGNQEYCRELLKYKDNAIGKLGTVIFQNFTPDGIPRFPKFKGVRFDV